MTANDDQIGGNLAFANSTDRGASFDNSNAPPVNQTITDVIEEESKQLNSAEEQQDMEPNHKDATNVPSKYTSPDGFQSENLLLKDTPSLKSS